MFKKKEITPNAYDIRLKTLISEWRDSRDALIAQVHNLIVKKNVIELYPEGADKNKAITEFEQRKKVLLNYIANYDSVYHKLMNFDYLKCERIIGGKWQYEKATSHAIIELAYENFYKR